MSRQHNASAARLRAFVGRIERLDEEIDERNQDKSAVYKEAGSEGFDLPVLRRLISDRRKMSKNPAKFDEQNEILQMYQAAMGSGTPRATRAPTTPAAEFDEETGEVLGDAPAPTPDSLGPLHTQEEQPSPSEPRSLTVGSPQYFSPAACANPAAAQEANGQSGMTATTPYRVTDPAPTPAAPDPDASPLIADAAARQAAARRLLGQSEAAE